MRTIRPWRNRALDNIGTGPMSFQSSVVPPDIRRTGTLGAAIPWLYLKGLRPARCGHLQPRYLDQGKYLTPATVLRWQVNQSVPVHLGRGCHDHDPMSSATLSRIQAQSGFRYERHKPEKTDLYQIVAQHLPGFRRQLTEAGISLPQFVHREFHSYLQCGLLEHGFVRVKCNGCRFEHLVAFSCKLRGFCPSCGAKSMIETAAHLIDNVIPQVSARQWVLSFPWPLRLLFAREPPILSQCLRLITRAIETDLIKRAGLTRASGAQTGIVTLIQRFGSALNLNIHLHMIVLDGVYTPNAGEPRFHRVTAPSQKTLETLLNRIIKRLVRKLERSGRLAADPQQPWLNFDDPEPLDSINAASIRYRIAMGPHSGNRTLTINNPAFASPDRYVKAMTANRDGFSLNAAVACQPHQRDRLERLCRYVTRPAICLDRLHLRADGQVQYQLKQPFADGTTHVVFSPLDFLSKLAALIPRPRHHLVRYHGVLAPNARMRKHVVPRQPKTNTDEKHAHHEPKHKPEPSQIHDPLIAPLTWAQRLKRVFNIDITLCPRCGGTLRVIAEITDPVIIQKILDHVAQPPPEVNPAATSS